MFLYQTSFSDKGCDFQVKNISALFQVWSFSCEEVVGGSFGKSLGAAHANGTPAAVDVRSPVRDPVGDILPDPVGDGDIRRLPPSVGKRQLLSFWRKKKSLRPHGNRRSPVKSVVVNSRMGNSCPIQLKSVQSFPQTQLHWESPVVTGCWTYMNIYEITEHLRYIPLWE